jgi:hypothetical protein
MPACSVDGRPTDTKLCAGCLDALKAELRALLPHWDTRRGRRELVPGLIAELDVTLTRQARIGERNGPRSTETPLPYHAGASVDLETIRTTLWMWAEALAKTGARLDVGPDPTELSKWFLRNPDSIARHEDVKELVDQVHSMTLAARRTIDLAPERRFVGPCDGHRAIVDNTIGCGKDLYASINAFTVTCHTDGCGAEYQIETRRAWLLEHAVDQLRTAAELSRELPWIAPWIATVTPRTRRNDDDALRKLINQWASRGQITRYLPHPRDTRNAPRFRVGEIIDKARDAATEHSRKTAS